MSTLAIRQKKQHSKSLRIALKILLTLIMLGFGLLMFFPFLWMLSSSFKSTYAIFDYPIKWIPDPLVVANYQKVWFGRIDFPLYYWNSIKVAVIGLVGTFISCSAAGYAYSKINFTGRNALFLLKLATTMIPAQVTVLPTYIIYSSLGLVNTHAALWITWVTGGAFGVFLMRQNFVTMPNELIDAAKIDGASHPGIFTRIALPIVKPAIATLLFIYFVWIWNDYEKPMYYIRTKDMYTLPLAVKFFQDDQFQDYAAIMAATMSALAPIIVMFFAAQKYMVQSVVSAGIKG